MSIPNNFTHQWQTGGVTLRAEVSPCCWMYSGYCLQLSIDLENGGRAIIQNKSIKYEEATEQDALALCQKIRVIPCKCCGKPAFDSSSIDTNREDKCEACWMEEWEAGWAKLQKEEATKLLRRDKRHLKLGYTHRITAWIHPAAGGDDYQIDAYSQGEPSKASIKAMLRKRGSRVLDDYQVFSLEEVTKAKN